MTAIFWLLNILAGRGATRRMAARRHRLARTLILQGITPLKAKRLAARV